MPRRVTIPRSIPAAAIALAAAAPCSLGAQAPVPAAAPAAAAPSPPADAAKYYLDYNVPESPAFSLLGVSPANVLRGAASKPVVVSLAGDLARGSRVGGGLALDVAPYAYFGRFRNVDEYKDKRWKRFLANALVSLAAVQAPNDTSSTAFAVGARVTFHDAHDLLANSDLQKLVGELLVPKTIDCPRVPGTNICQPGSAPQELPVDLSSAYATAREQVLKKTGWGVSAGGAFGATLRGGIPRSDSLKQRRGHAWLAGTRYMGAGHEFLTMAEWARDTARADRFRTGAAYRRQTQSSSVSAELAYDTGAGGLLPGANAEVRLLQRVTLIAAIVTDVPATTADRKRVRFKTSLRWTGTEAF